MNQLECVLCNANVESIDHLLFSCSKSSQIWQAIYGWAGQEYVPCIGSKAHFLNHWQMVSGEKFQQLWLSVWFETIWSIWLMRNRIVFKQEGCDLVQIMDLIKVRAWSWLALKVERGKFSYSDWCMAPLACLKSRV